MKLTDARKALQPPPSVISLRSSSEFKSSAPQIHILTDQFTAQLIAKEVQLQALNGEVQALRHQCESRLKELEDALGVRRLEPGSGRR
jgi:hypothetical protein